MHHLDSGLHISVFSSLNKMPSTVARESPLWEYFTYNVAILVGS